MTMSGYGGVLLPTTGFEVLVWRQPLAAREETFSHVVGWEHEASALGSATNTLLCHDQLHQLQ